MALNANALMDFAKLQTYTSRTASEQTKFEGLINVACARFENYTSRSLASAPHTETLDNFGMPTDLISVTDYPVTAITKLYVDASSAFAAASEVPVLTNGVGYILDTDSGLIYLKGYVVPSGSRVAKITYTSGYAINSAPEDLQWALSEYVTWLASRMDSRVIGQRYSSLDGMNITSETDIPAHVKSILDDYARLD